MNVDLLYSGGTLTLEFPDDITVDVFAPVEVTTSYSFETFKSDFERGGGGRLVSAEHPVLIVNDAHRNTPTSNVLEWIDEIDNHFFDRVTIVIATGTHAAPTEKGLDRIFGRFLARLKKPIRVHEARYLDNMTKVGEDRFGKPVYIDTAVAEAEVCGVIGSVEPHYFAGYTGGRKGVFPGVMDQETTARNHNLANSLDAAPLRLDGNPVAEHLAELMQLVDRERFVGIQLVHDADGNISAAHVGPLNESFEAVLPEARRVYSRQADQAYDCVICEVRPPLDRSLYQVQKALENNQGAVKDGGELLLVSACRDGIGTRYFYDLAGKWDRDANRPEDGHEQFGSHKLSRVNSIGKRIDVRLYSELDNESVRHVFYEPVEDIFVHLREIIHKQGAARVAVVKDAGNMVLSR